MNFNEKLAKSEAVQTLTNLHTLTEEDVKIMRNFYEQKTGIPQLRHCNGCLSSWVKLYRNCYNDFVKKQQNIKQEQESTKEPTLTKNKRKIKKK